MSSLLLFGSDHRGFALKGFLVDSIPLDIEDLGCDSGDVSVDYPVYATSLAREIKSNPNKKGVLICGSGHGMYMVVNRYNWIRAAFCHSAESAILARQHNDANVIVFGADFINEQNALECLLAFLDTEFSFEEKHKSRINLFSDIRGSG